MDIAKEIEDLYFLGRFKEVVQVWEKFKGEYQFDLSRHADNNTLEAIAISYFEMGMYKKSLYYINIQIEQLKTLDLPNHEKKKKIRYYYLSKINIYSLLRKRRLEYTTIWDYLMHFEKDDTFIEFSNSLEDYFYRKFALINKYIGCVILLLVLIAIAMPILNIHIPSNIYRPYNIVSAIFVLWIASNLIFPSYFKALLLRVVRYFLRPPY